MDGKMYDSEYKNRFDGGHRLQRAKEVFRRISELFSGSSRSLLGMDKITICRICRRQATGVHYRVLACGGCKAFYRRAVVNKLAYHCRQNGACSTLADYNGRVRCRACRLEKCQSLGMKIRGAEYSQALLTQQSEASSGDESVNQAISQHSNPSPCSDYLEFETSGDSGSYTKPINLVPNNEARPFVTHKVVLLNHANREEQNNSTGGKWWAQENARSEFPLLDNQYAGQLDANRRQIATTVYAVEAAILENFGDQISKWTVCRDEALLHGKIVSQPETSLENMIAALNVHNGDNVVRTQQFASMLPGMAEAESSAESSAKRCVAVGWKAILYWMIHHADFMTHAESYVTVGPQQFHYCRYWQDQITDPQLLAAFYKVCTAFREIGLSQTERYLFMAVVMFEPEEDQSLRLKVIHRHYTDVLLEVVKQRCIDSHELSNTCAKLNYFFELFPLIHTLHGQYYASTSRSQRPVSSKLHKGHTSGSLLSGQHK